MVSELPTLVSCCVSSRISRLRFWSGHNLGHKRSSHRSWFRLSPFRSHKTKRRKNISSLLSRDKARPTNLKTTRKVNRAKNGARLQQPIGSGCAAARWRSRKCYSIPHLRWYGNKTGMRFFIFLCQRFLNEDRDSNLTRYFENDR